MGKGAGGGSGGVSGRPGTSSAVARLTRSQVGRIVGGAASAIGGVAHGDFLRDEGSWRPSSMAYWREHFAKGDPTKLATSLSQPIRVAIDRSQLSQWKAHGFGKTGVHVIDGRHRMRSAKEAGATRIRVEAWVKGSRLGESRVWKGTVKL